MSLGLYHHAASPLHRAAAGPKLAALALAGTAAAFVADWRWLAGGSIVTMGLFALARIPPRVALAQLRPVLGLLLLIVAVQVLVEGAETGLRVGLRVATLVLAAALVTLTTRQSDMVEAIEAVLRPLGRVGVDPVKVGLALSLAIRLIPLIADEARLVRDAQRARGLDRNVVALAVPLVVRALTMADDLAEAIDARSGGD